jgi:hypothetical protein
MSISNSHLDKADHNKEFLNSIIETSFIDWVVIVTFYFILHCIDAELYKTNTVPIRNHMQRHRLVSSILPSLFDDYGVLYARARYARYEPQSHIRINDQYIGDTLTLAEKICNNIP